MYNININWYKIISTTKKENPSITDARLFKEIKKALKAEYYFNNYELEELNDEIHERLSG